MSHETRQSGQKVKLGTTRCKNSSQPVSKLRRTARMTTTDNLYSHLNICVLLSCWLVSKFTASAPDLNSLRSPFGVSPLHLLMGSYRLSELGSEPKQTGVVQRQCQLNGRNHTRQLHTKTHDSDLHVYRTPVHPVGWMASLWRCCFSFSFSIGQLHSVFSSFHLNRLQKQAVITISSNHCGSKLTKCWIWVKSPLRAASVVTKKKRKSLVVLQNVKQQVANYIPPFVWLSLIYT